MEKIKTNSLKAWILASRPKTLAAAISPVLTGCALAAYYHSFKIIVAIICLLFAILMQIAANLINDLIDYQKGSDGKERLGPERATSQGWITPNAMKKGIFIVVLCACFIGLGILYFTTWKIIFVGITCIIFAYLYTSGPFPLSYNGLGDITVIFFFGLIPVGFTCYAQCEIWTVTVTFFAISVGMAINSLLIVNNYRDRDTDKKSGKRTIIVILGEKFGRYFYLINGFSALSICLILFFYNEKYLSMCLMLIYGIRHWKTWKKLCQIREGKQLNSLIGDTSLNMILFSVLITVGLFV